MQNLEDQIQAAWKRVQSRLEDEPALLSARLARRRKPTLTRSSPLAPSALAIRASRSQAESLRPPPPSFTPSPCHPITPSRFLPRPNRTPDHHNNAPAKKALQTRPPGTSRRAAGRRRQKARPHAQGPAQRASQQHLPHALHPAHRRPRQARFPLPLPPNQPLDPTARRFATADPVWLWTANYLFSRLPDDFEQTLTRIPSYRPHAPKHFYNEHAHPELEESEPKKRRLKLPTPEIELSCWYKWSRSGHFLGTDHTNWRKSPQDLGERPRRDKPTPWKYWNRKPRPSQSDGSDHFNGFQWRCPNCQKTCRTLYYPVAPINLLAHSQPKIAQMIDIPRKLKGFACAKCHRVRFNSTISKDYWNEVITYLTAGLLYGHEVPRPIDQFPKTRKNNTPQDPTPNHPSAGHKSSSYY